MPIPLQNSIVYGPIQSRRLGVSLGINLLPTDRKFCLSNCIYCQYGWTDPKTLKGIKSPSKESVMEEIKKIFETKAAENFHIDKITFCGNGEPTLHPELGVIVKETKQLRDRFFPQTKIGIMSDSSRVHLSHIRSILNDLDERYMKLDVGTATDYQSVNQPMANVDWREMVEGLKQLDDSVIQSLFISEPINNSVGERFEKWLGVLEEINPREVYVYTLDRPPADISVKAISNERLEEIQREVERKTGFQTLAFSQSAKCESMTPPGE